MQLKLLLPSLPLQKGETVDGGVWGYSGREVVHVREVRGLTVVRACEVRGLTVVGACEVRGLTVAHACEVKGLTVVRVRSEG